MAVEEVTGGKALVRFAELPAALHGEDARFAPLVMAWERYRLDVHRNPFFETGDAAFFMARRLGRPVGRITAHLAGPGPEGAFGFWWLDDDAAVAAALIEAARSWLTERGTTSMVGPLSFTADEESGVQVTGHDVAGVTGRPWHPPHLAAQLEGAGFEAVEDHRMWRLPAVGPGPQRPPGEDLPGQAAGYLDRRLVLAGIAAVPDVAEALRTTGLRGAWSLAKRAKAADWDTCTVVRCRADPAVAVPALQAAAGEAGYRAVIAPWSPDPAALPETVHRTYRLTW